MLNRLLSHPLFLFAVVALLYCLAIPVDIMEVDSAQYYSMTNEMMRSGNWLEFTDRGKPYLDKPPFIFWISGLFFQIFGSSEFAFKLPSILFSILGWYATYRLALLFYDKQTARLAALMLATSQGYFHFNNDIRTDTYLTNSVITAVWMLSEFLYGNRKAYWWIGGFAFIGIGMLAKGPMGLVAPAAALGSHILLRGEWKSILRWQWIAGLVVTLLVLSPMLYGLYTQYDARPDTLVNGKTGVSGIRFFFWEQSFGRITGENVWKNDTGPFFFVHNMAWSFLPWSVLFVAGLVKQFGRLREGISLWPKSRPEWISLGGFLLPFIALSMSKYKLPHYIYVTFPFAAVFTASYFMPMIEEGTVRLKKALISIQVVVLFGSWAFGGLIFLYFFPLENPLLMLVGALGFGSFLFFGFRRTLPFYPRFFLMSIATSFSINILLSTHFYPSILEYQSSAHAGAYAVKAGLPLDRLYVFDCNGRALDVYTNHVQREAGIETLSKALEDGQPVYVYTQREGRQKLEEAGFRVNEEFNSPHYPVTLLTMNFGNPATRESVLNKGFILKLQAADGLM